MQLKPISKESIPNALTRAKHYRLLNEPWQAESICRDILTVDPNNQIAILYLILAITDQFSTKKGSSSAEAKRLCSLLTDEYENKYYSGLVAERIGQAALKRNTPRIRYIAFDHYSHAMNFYEEAEKIHPEGNEDSKLRWNACMRAIDEFKLEPSPDEDEVQPFLDM